MSVEVIATDWVIIQTYTVVLTKLRLLNNREITWVQVNEHIVENNE